MRTNNVIIYQELSYLWTDNAFIVINLNIINSFNNYVNNIRISYTLRVHPLNKLSR